MSILPEPDAQLRLTTGLVTMQRAQSTGDGGVDLIVVDADGKPQRVLLTAAQLDKATVPTNDRAGEPHRALCALWGRWMQHAVPRIRSAVLATRPLVPYAHQDEAVHYYMLKAGSIAQYMDMSTPVQDVTNCPNTSSNGREQRMLTCSMVVSRLVLV
jgi:hypothetical protein